MKVKELIEQLQKVDPETEVQVDNEVSFFTITGTCFLKATDIPTFKSQADMQKALLMQEPEQWPITTTAPVLLIQIDGDHPLDENLE